MKKKADKMKGLEKCPMVWLPGSDALPPGAVKDIVLAAEENGGWLDLDSPAIFDGMKISLADLVSAFMVLADPLHPQNKWSCLAEKVRLGDRRYLRLVTCIPEWVKSSWSPSDEHPHCATSWLTPDLVKSLFPEPPRSAAHKIPSRKPKPAARKAPARKPDQPIEETPEQKKKALWKIFLQAIEIDEMRKKSR